MRKIMMALGIFAITATAAQAAMSEDESLFAGGIVLGTAFCPEYVTKDQKQALLGILQREGFTEAAFKVYVAGVLKYGLENPEVAAISCNALQKIHQSSNL